MSADGSRPAGAGGPAGVEPGADVEADVEADVGADAEPLADGRYRDDAVDRWPRVGLSAVAAVSILVVVVVGADALSVGLGLGLALVALGARALLLRPRLEVGATGLRLVGVLGARHVSWARVAGAGARPVPGPLGRVEQCLVVHVEGGRKRRVRVVRGGVDRATGVAPQVADLAAALVERARREVSDPPAAG